MQSLHGARPTLTINTHKEYRMHIELTSKNVYWYGSKGVVIHAQVNVHEEIEDLKPGLVKIGAVQRLEIDLTGTDTKPEISIQKSGWSKLQSVDDATLVEDLHRWVMAGNPLGWDQEVAKYQAGLSKVDLPCPPEDVQTENKCLIYKVTIVGEDDFKVALPLEVKEKTAMVSIGLLKGGAQNYINIGDCYIDDTINLDTLKAAVMPAMERFMKGVQNLMGRVALPVTETEV